MFESTNERTARVIYALTTGKGIENLDRIDMVIAYLLLLAMLMITIIVAPAALYDEIYQRYAKRKQHKQTRE